MGPEIAKLLEISGNPLGPAREPIRYAPPSKLSNELSDLLREKNGFFAFEMALHVFPLESTSKQASGYDLKTWNDKRLWIDGYEGFADEYLFFSEDAFGEQFCIKDTCIYRFDPETAEITPIASDLEGWARQLLSNYSEETGWATAHEWQVQNRQLYPFERLLPKIPFVLGGRYEPDNLYAGDALEGMRFRSEIWRQSRHFPPGTKVKFQITD